MLVCLLVLVAVLLLTPVLFCLDHLAKRLSRQQRQGFARRPASGPTAVDQSSTPTRKKPDWVVQEVLRLKALMGKHAGCRKVANTFNRLHAPTWVGKSFVSETIHNHQYALLNITRKLRDQRPAPVRVNRVWGVALTFVPARIPADADDAAALDQLCPDLEEWPRTWRTEESEVIIGQRVVEMPKPFLQDLLHQGLTDKTLSRHRDHAWMLGGEIIRRRHEDFDLCKQPVKNCSPISSKKMVGRLSGHVSLNHNKTPSMPPACQQSGNQPGHHFAGAGKMVDLGSGSQRELEDYHLSRFACYLIAQNGDPRKPEIAQAQKYFAVQVRRQELSDQAAADLERLELRKQTAEEFKSLSGAAQDAGVQSKMFGVFHDAGYKGLYGGLGRDAIKQRKTIPENDNLLDRMNATELAANQFRMTQTRDKLARDGVRNQAQAIQTHEQVGKEVRDAIKRIGGTPPENIPPAEHIKELEKRLKGAT